MPLSPVRFTFLPADQTAAHKLVNQLAGGRSREPEVGRDGGDSLRFQDELQCGNLWGCELRRMEDRQGASSIMAMHRAQEPVYQNSECGVIWFHPRHYFYHETNVGAIDDESLLSSSG